MNKELAKDALIYIASKDLIHGDIKPGNILVSNRGGRLRAFVGDFGLTGKSGGSPIFMAPEGLDKDSRIVGKTDLYSFGITFLFLMFPADLAIKLLFLPLENLKQRKSFVESLSNFDLLLWIFKSLCGDPKSRIDLDDWEVMIEKMKNMKISEEKFTLENLEEKGVDFKPLQKASENEASLLFFIMDFFRFAISSTQVNKNEWRAISTAKSHKLSLSLLNPYQKLSIFSKDEYYQSFIPNPLFKTFSDPRSKK